jgi:hypothetical protein
MRIEWFDMVDIWLIYDWYIDVCTHDSALQKFICATAKWVNLCQLGISDEPYRVKYWKYIYNNMYFKTKKSNTPFHIYICLFIYLFENQSEEYSYILCLSNLKNGSKTMRCRDVPQIAGTTCGWASQGVSSHQENGGGPIWSINGLVSGKS